MDAEPICTVALSPLTYHVLTLLARIERTTPQEIAERVVAAYLEDRLGTIREAYPESEVVAGLGRVIDLAERRGSQRPTRSSRSTGSRRRSSISSE